MLELSFSHECELEADRAVDAEMIQFISSNLPHLHTLELWATPGVDFTPLLRLHNLASLRMKDELADDSRQLQVVSQFFGLTHLHVSRPWLHGDRFRCFFGSARLFPPNLTSLSLLGMRATERILDPASDVMAAFAAMRNLHSLQLKWTAHIDNLLPYLARAPRLTRLIVEPSQFLPILGMHDHTLPSPAALTALLAEAPNLHVVLHMHGWAKVKHFRHLMVAGRMTILHEPLGT
jgi:hypothetical protein